MEPLKTLKSNSSDKIFKDLLVHKGFQDLYLQLREATMNNLLKLINIYPEYKIVFVGNSLGAALAEFAAVDFVYRYGYKDRVMCISYGTPRIGNREYARFVNDLNFKRRRLVTPGDPISHLRNFIPNQAPRIFGFHHVHYEFRFLSNGMVYACKPILITGECPDVDLALFNPRNQ